MKKMQGRSADSPASFILQTSFAENMKKMTNYEIRNKTGTIILQYIYT